MNIFFLVIFIMEGFLFIFFGILIAGVLSIVIWSSRNGIGPMPSSPKAKKMLLRSLPEEVEGTIYELGCGWGTLLFPIARRYPQNQVVGFENSPVPFGFCCLRKMLFPLSNLTIRPRNFFSASLKEASLVVCYLYPGAMRLLKSKFEKELAPGTWIITNTFAMPGWRPLYTYEIQDLYHSKIYVYRTS